MKEIGYWLLKIRNKKVSHTNFVNLVKRCAVCVALFISITASAPFNIFADTVIPYYYLNGDSLAGHLQSVTNFCDNVVSNSACQLRFYFDEEYFGVIYFRSNINTDTDWAVYVAGAEATYNYRNTSNNTSGITYINNVYGSITILKDVDLTNIVQQLVTLNNSTNTQNSLITGTNNLLTTIKNEILENNELTEDTNELLQKIYEYRSWNFPIESLSAVNGCFDNNLELADYYNNASYTFPIFNIYDSDKVHTIATNKGNKFIWKFYSNYYYDSDTVLNTIFTLNDGDLVTSSRSEVFFYNGKRMRLYTVEIGNFTKSTVQNKITFHASESYVYIPIYLHRTSYQYISTDFALKFGLSNSMLDDIHLLAQGNTASSDSASDAQSANEDLATESSTLFNQEDSFKQDMNNAMQNINTGFNMSDFGAGFVNSAQWVRSQYENLTNNTPFASLITFSLLIGISMIMLGKVYK